METLAVYCLLCVCFPQLCVHTSALCFDCGFVCLSVCAMRACACMCLYQRVCNTSRMLNNTGLPNNSYVIASLHSSLFLRDAPSFNPFISHPLCRLQGLSILLSFTLLICTTPPPPLSHFPQLFSSPADTCHSLSTKHTHIHTHLFVFTHSLCLPLSLQGTVCADRLYFQN